MVSWCVGDQDASVGSSQTDGEDLALGLVLILVLVLVLVLAFLISFFLNRENLDASMHG